MNRFSYALEAATAPEQKTLIDLARNFVAAVEQTEIDGENADSDPAVLLLGAFIAFHTHADISNVGGYRRLLRICEDRIVNFPELQ